MKFNLPKLFKWNIKVPYLIALDKIIHMCSILTKGSTCRKNKKLRFFLILIGQVMTNLFKKKLAF